MDQPRVTEAWHGRAKFYLIATGCAFLPLIAAHPPIIQPTRHARRIDASQASVAPIRDLDEP
jgi:hypothetical protein